MFIFLGGVIAYATVPNTFNNGDLLSASKMNDNFNSLDTRVTALEKALNTQPLVTRTKTTSAVTLTTTTADVGSIQFTAPVAGIATLTATGGCYLPSGAEALVYLASTAGGADGASAELTNDGTTSANDLPLALTYSFPVTAGQQTLHLTGRLIAAGSGNTMCGASLTVVFSPSAIPSM